jgi:hypothetical protein
MREIVKEALKRFWAKLDKILRFAQNDRVFNPLYVILRRNAPKDLMA